MRISEAIARNWPDGDLMVACPENCEGGFSWSECDGCGSLLGGDRHPAVWISPEGKRYDEINICADCLMLLANGEDSDRQER